MKYILLIIMLFCVEVRASNSTFFEIIPQYKEQKDYYFQLELDFSKRSLENDIFYLNDRYPLSHLKKFSLIKISKNKWDWIFHGQKGQLALVIRNLNVNNLVSKASGYKNKCIDKLQNHLQEYNRTSYVIYSHQNVTSTKLNFDNNQLYDFLLSKSITNKFPVQSFVVTNNCRGSGNFEFEWPGMFSGYLELPRKVMRELLGREEWPSAGTELRFSRYYYDQFQKNNWLNLSTKEKVLSWIFNFRERDYRWVRVNDFDSLNCSYNDLVNSLLSIKNNFIEISLKYDKGKIPYNEFLGETRMKSGASRDREPLSYIKTPCKKSNETPPMNFLVQQFLKSKSADNYWQKGSCEILPHHYVNYADIIKYTVYLSHFEVDGHYSGQSQSPYSSSLSSYDSKLLKDDRKRRPYQYYKYIPHFIKAEKAINEKLLTIKLTNKYGKNFIIGNIPLENLSLGEKQNSKVTIKGQKGYFSKNILGISGPLGINPNPLNIEYNDLKIDSKEKPLFALFYDHSGNILNHHDQSIGIDYWYLRQEKCQYILDLVSHERILPIARLKLARSCQK
ncbi:MAG: hypothetical protein HN576_10060 [Bacteriovoracaceae bacterium]|jgi:hypothetical protein|nr:hypothetical protein [Bacteriovoracaceae bacterium]